MSGTETTTNPLRQIWGDGNCALGAWSVSPDPVLAEILGRAGFDFVIIDLQHGWHDLGNLPSVVHAFAVAGTVPLVRVPANEVWLVGRALDSGAYGVMVPLVETAAQAEKAVRACRYPPDGGRSVGAFRAAPLIASNAVQANREIVCIVQIESATAVENIESICATPGLDAVYIGPGDMALSMGVESVKSDSPHTLQRVADVAHDCAIAAGMHAESGADARWAIHNGFDLTTTGADVDFMFDAARASIGVALDNREAVQRPHPDLVPRYPVPANNHG